MVRGATTTTSETNVSSDTNGNSNSNSSSTNGVENVSHQQQPSLSVNDDRHIENTVIFVPNVWTLMPTSVEYDKIAETYKSFIDNPPLPPPPTTTSSSSSMTTTLDKQTSSKSTNDVKPNSVASTQSDAKQQQQQPNKTETSNAAESTYKTTSLKVEQMTIVKTVSEGGESTGSSNRVSIGGGGQDDQANELKPKKALNYVFYMIKKKHIRYEYWTVWKFVFRLCF